MFIVGIMVNAIMIVDIITNSIAIIIIFVVIIIGTIDMNEEVEIFSEL